MADDEKKLSVQVDSEHSFKIEHQNDGYHIIALYKEGALTKSKDAGKIDKDTVLELTGKGETPEFVIGKQTPVQLLDFGAFAPRIRVKTEKPVAIHGPFQFDKDSTQNAVVHTNEVNFGRIAVETGTRKKDGKEVKVNTLKSSTADRFTTNPEPGQKGYNSKFDAGVTLAEVGNSQYGIAPGAKKGIMFSNPKNDKELFASNGAGTQENNDRFRKDSVPAMKQTIAAILDVNQIADEVKKATAALNTAKDAKAKAEAQKALNAALSAAQKDFIKQKSDVGIKDAENKIGKKEVIDKDTAVEKMSMTMPENIPDGALFTLNPLSTPGKTQAPGPRRSSNQPVI